MKISKPVRFERQTILIVSILLFVVTLFIFHACKKEPPQREFIGEKQIFPVSDRDPFEVTLAWLETFQTSLDSAITYSAMSRTFTPEQVAAGVEALINLATVSPVTRSMHNTKVTDFPVTITSGVQVLEDIYNEAYDAYRDHWLSMDTTETYPVVIEVSIVSIVGSTINVRATTIVGVCNSCLLSNYTNTSNECDGEAFETDEAYYVGAGDEELSLGSVYVLPMCNWSCGETPACSSPASTAWEQIEARINFNYLANNPPCEPGTVLQGFINVSLPIYAQGPEYDFLEDDCSIVGQEVGECMEDEALNCAYCSFYEQIGTAPFEIPEDKYLVSLNLGVDYCICGENGVCEYLAHPIAEYTYGCPVCSSVPPPVGWNDPVLVDLRYLSTP